MSFGPFDDAMLRSMALGRCPYADGPHDFVMGVCRLCLEERDALAKRAERAQLFELRHECGCHEARLVVGCACWCHREVRR